MGKIRDFLSEREKFLYMRSLSGEEKMQMFREMLEDSSSVVFLGGAGVSTESGLPDYRSKNGLYHQKDKQFSRYHPEYLLSYDCLRTKPELFFAYYRKYLDMRHAEPNMVHKRLAKMEKAGKLAGIITQNIDGLHQKAGSLNVQEIHGTIRKNHCVSCGSKFDENFIFDSEDEIPHCPYCGRMVRPDVTLYGEILPSPAYENAVELIRNADCLIIGGTSLKVGSAASMAQMFKGPYRIVINKGFTGMDTQADLVFHESISLILRRLEDPGIR